MTGIWPRKAILSYTVPVFFFSLLICHSVAYGLIPERRRQQKSAEPNQYYIVPWFVRIEGIGTLLGGVGGIANVVDSGTNLAFINFQNDKFHIRGLAIDDVFLLGDYNSPSSLTVTGGDLDIELKNLDVYEIGRDSDSQPFQVKGTLKGRALQIQWRLFIDRLKLSYEPYYGKDSIRLADQMEFGRESENRATRYKIELDLTDDRYDSRTGVRGIWILSKREPAGNIFGDNETEEEYDIVSRELSLFLPLYASDSQVHTLAFNYYLSTTHQINPNIPLNRRNGNELGGPVRMRGYPNRRFVDNHTLYYAVEHRWTFLGAFGTDGDGFLLSNDTLEGLQLAFFYEWGQVSEFLDDSLYRDMKTDYGIGIRAVWDSTLVMRLDVGISEEGAGTNFIIVQPF